MDTIEFTEGLRNACNIEALKDYFFLYPGNNAAIYHFNATTFRDCLKAACLDPGLSKNYNASNLRDTHMTKALEHIIRNGKSDLEMGLLTKHKHLDTTKTRHDIEDLVIIKNLYGAYLEAIYKIKEAIE